MSWYRFRDHLFMVFHGTIAAPAEGEQLAQRMSQTMFATNHNKMLLVWSFMAPTSTELATMPDERHPIRRTEPIELSSALAAKQCQPRTAFQQRKID